MDLVNRLLTRIARVILWAIGVKNLLTGTGADPKGFRLPSLTRECPSGVSKRTDGNSYLWLWDIACFSLPSCPGSRSQSPLVSLQ